MPKKKIRKPKTREYLEKLLDNVGLTDRELAQAIKNGIESENATERAKALEMAGQWKGFAEVDKKVGDEIEHLPLANISKAELDRLANRCAYCKHKQFESIHGGKVEQPKEPVIPVVDPITPQLSEEEVLSLNARLAVSIPDLVEPFGNPGSDEVIPAIPPPTPIEAEPVKETNEQTTQEKAD